MRLDITKIEDMTKKGYIVRKKHPLHNLYLLNYTHKTTADNEWNAATIICRGLIVDSQWNIVARPFPKFFNVSQLSFLRNRIHHLYRTKYSKLWTTPFTAFEKFDGSLGIIYRNPNNIRWEIATRGSFTSEQAQEGQKILRHKTTLYDLKPHYTYLVEIIYPTNRIVVDYGPMRDLVLLSVIDNKTGEDCWEEFDRLRNEGWTSSNKIEGLHYMDQLEGLDSQDNIEGYVLVFPNGFRLKYKFNEYLRLHKILTGTTEKRIWDLLRNNQDLSQWLYNVPDEFHKWVTNLVDDFQKRYQQIEDESWQTFNQLRNKSRKDIALSIQDYPYKGIIFAMLDDKNYEDIIWKFLEPKCQDHQ
jgi:hypothetical protein